LVPTRREKQVGRPEGFEAVFVADDGVEQRVPWSFMPDVVAELGRPVRSFPSYRGHRNYPGLYWSATMGGRIGDFAPSVVRIVSQPFWLWWSNPAGKRRRHAPDFLVLLEDGSAEGAVLVLDSRPLELIAEEDRAAFDATDRAYALLDWRYAVWDRFDGVVVANQKWLAGYRHPRCYVEPVAGRPLEVFTRPRPLMDVAEAAGDPLGTLPVLGLKPVRTEHSAIGVRVR
jgi:hypothetical protein